MSICPNLVKIVQNSGYLHEDLCFTLLAATYVAQQQQTHLAQQQQTHFCASMAMLILYLLHLTVAGIFHWHNPSGRTMARGMTQPLTEMSTRNISFRVQAASELGWQPHHLHV